jgi:hypothetical protein
VAFIPSVVHVLRIDPNSAAHTHSGSAGTVGLDGRAVEKQTITHFDFLHISGTSR